MRVANEWMRSLRVVTGCRTNYILLLWFGELENYNENVYNLFIKCGCHSLQSRYQLSCGGVDILCYYGSIICFLVAYEAHVSTETTKKSPNARIPRASTVGDGTARASAPSPQRTRPSFRVTDMEASHRSSRAVVREVLANGRRVPTALGRFVLGRPGQETGRIFFVVSKSVAKRSTARNRVRRP